MREQITAKLWRRKDSDATGEWQCVGTRVTAALPVLAEIEHRYRIANYYESATWWEYVFFAVPDPIRSRDNPVLAEFRDMLESIIYPHTSKEAAWWLQLIERDPGIKSEDYWGSDLVEILETCDDGGTRYIEHAVKVLTRLRNGGL